ncbi:MAG TPA: site-specific integrase [Gammaproteobacteria bacterium]|nr:site-specific integrase [Gammaproteobacteria bacterium]
MIYSVSDVVEYYLQRRVLTDVSINQYRVVAARFERNVVSELTSITEDRLLAWRDQVLARASGTTFNNYLRHLRAVFNYAERRGVLPIRNHFRELSYAPTVRRRNKTLEDGALDKAIRYLQASDAITPSWFWLALVRFMAHTGVRARQVVTLRWHDIDFVKKTICLRAEGSKTRREWSIPLTDGVAADLRRLRIRTEKIVEVKSGDQVFNVTRLAWRYRGPEMTVEQLCGFFRRLSERIGCKISARRLRHSFGTQLGNAETPDIMAIKEIMGHTDIRTTQIYIAVKVDHMRKVMSDAGIC